MCFTDVFLSLVIEKENDIVFMVLDDCRIYHSVVDARGHTLLHYAAKYNNHRLIRHIILSKRCVCHVDDQNLAGSTPLMLAVQNAYVKSIELLLLAGADVDVKDRHNKSAMLHSFDRLPQFRVQKLLFFALKKKSSNSIELARRMIGENYSINRAVYVHDAKAIGYMLERGRPVASSKYEDVPALHTAVMSEDDETVGLLLRYGADPMQLDWNGQNTLMVLPCFFSSERRTVKRENLEILKLLLSAGASPTSLAPNGAFSLENSLIYGYREIVRVILQSIADFAVKQTVTGETLLHLIAKNTHPGIASVLEDYIDRFDVNVADKSGRKPLHGALLKANVEMVRLLLRNGAETGAALFYVCSTSRSSRQHRHFKCVELLLRYNVDPQVTYRDRRGKKITFFDVAMKHNNHSRINTVLEHLALLERKTVPISKLTRSKVNAQPTTAMYFQRCQRILGEKLWDSASLFDMLTADQEAMAKYLNNHRLVIKLMRLRRKPASKYVFRYYYTILKQKFTSSDSSENSWKWHSRGVSCNNVADPLP